MTIELPALEQAEAVARPASSGRLRRWARPALGLLLPVGLALAWEIAVWLGLSNGRLVPPPTQDFRDHRRTGAQRRARASYPGDAEPRARGLRPWRDRRHGARRRLGLLGPGAPAARSHRAGAARDPVDRLGAAVHPVARHFRNLESRADRGRGVFPGLSRRDGRDPVGRSQDRRGRPHLPPVRTGDDPAHPAAGGVAGLCGVAAGRSWAGLDVRGRRRIHGRLRRPRLSPDRRPATRQARANPGGDRDLRHPRQDHRLADRDRFGAAAALAGRDSAAKAERPDAGARYGRKRSIPTASTRWSAFPPRSGSARSSPSSAAPVAESRRCCAPSPASTAPPRAP